MHTNAYIIFQEKNENKLVNISSTLTLVVEVVAQVQLLNHFWIFIIIFTDFQHNKWTF